MADSLTQRLSQTRRPSDVNWLPWCSPGIAEALPRRAWQRVIHRDLKPDNIMIAGDPNDASRVSSRPRSSISDAAVAESQVFGPTL